MLPVKTKVQAHPTYPVVVDWSNPLTRGLVGAWLFNGSKPVNLADPRNDTTINGGVAYKAGRGYKFNGVDGYLSVADQAPFELTTPTVHAMVRDITLAHSMLAYKGENSAGYFLRHRTSGGVTKFEWQINKFGAVGLDWIIPDLSKTHFVGGSVGDRGVELWVDGTLEGASTAKTDTSLNATDFVIGRHTEILAQYSVNTISLTIVHNRQLSEAEHKSLAADPYQIFKPAVDQVYFVADEATGVALVANPITSGGTLGKPALTQNLNFLADPIKSGGTLEQPLLTQDAVLLANPITSGGTLGKPVLTQNLSFLADAIKSAGTLDQPLLTQDATLVADAVKSGGTLGKPALTQNLNFLADAIKSGGTLGQPIIVEPLVVGNQILLHRTFVNTVPPTTLAAGEPYVVLDNAGSVDMYVGDINDDPILINPANTPIGGVELNYRWDADLTVSEPANGDVKINGAQDPALPSPATIMSINDISANNADLHVLFQNIVVGDILGVFETGGAGGAGGEAFLWKITAAPINHTTWWEIEGFVALYGGDDVDDHRPVTVYYVPDPSNKLPLGGTTGQHLTKVSNADFDTEWTDVGGGGSTAGIHALARVTAEGALEPDALNIASVTPQAAGVYDYLFTSLASNANYIVTGTLFGNTGSLTIDAQSSSGFTLNTFNNSGVAINRNHAVSVLVNNTAP